ncbi:MAG: leucine-rich repeat domain-containing protein [Clostridia bacterium]|nr:leucine-rich repeat domain-containing protein [Clostridia bacterium]
MKKLFIKIASAIFVLGMSLGFAGCNLNALLNSSTGESTQYSTSETHEHTGEWIANEWTHYWQYTCGCPAPDIAELHMDYDANNVCDVCGWVLTSPDSSDEPHVHVYKQIPTENTLCGLASCKYPAEYYCVCDCGAVDTTTTFYYGDTLPHEPRAYYGYDEENHYEICDVCGQNLEPTAHTFEGECCNICKYSQGDSLGLSFTENEDGTGYLVNGKGSFNGETLSIPRYHKGLPVVGMSPYAFGWLQAKTVKIHGGIQEICGYAFYGCDAETIILEEGIEYIGESAFWHCRFLRQLTLPTTVKTIGEGAFCWNNLRTLVIPEGVTHIGKSAFIGSLRLLHVTLPSTLQTIEPSAFGNCPKLMEVKNLSSLELESGAKDVFGEICENAKHIYKDGDTNYYVNDGGFVFYRYGEGGENILLDCLRENPNLVLPDDCRGESYTVGESAFYQQEWIKTLTFGNQVTTVGEDAFSHCTALEKVTFSPSVKTLQNGAFYYNINLEEINFAEGLEGISQSVFYRCEKVKALHLPASLKNILYSFGEMNALEEITVAEGSPFYVEGNCLIYKDGHTQEKSLVLGCKNSIIPNGKVETILRRAFNCSSLTALEIPDSVKEIEAGAFTECPATILENGVWYVDNWCIGFDGSTKAAAVIKEGTVGLASAGEGWLLGSSSCMSLRDIEKVVLPNSLQHISDGFFYDWDGEIVWGSAPTMKTIEAYAFQGYLGTAFTIPDSVEVIEEYAFHACYGLQEIVVPEGVIEIQEGAFYYCTELKKLHLPSTLVSLGEGFYGMGVMEEITVQHGNEHYQVMNGCLVEIVSKKALLLTKDGTLPDGGTVEILPLYLLHNREETELIIPEGVKEIESFAIYKCENLTAIYLPKSIKILVNRWIEDCDNLTDIYYAGTEAEWIALWVTNIKENVTVHFLGGES